jgi:hypothetical protein
MPAHYPSTAFAIFAGSCCCSLRHSIPSYSRWGAACASLAETAETRILLSRAQAEGNEQQGQPAYHSSSSSPQAAAAVCIKGEKELLLILLFLCSMPQVASGPRHSGLAAPALVQLEVSHRAYAGERQCDWGPASRMVAVVVPAVLAAVEPLRRYVVWQGEWLLFRGTQSGWRRGGWGAQDSEGSAAVGVWYLHPCFACHPATRSGHS